MLSELDAFAIKKGMQSRSKFSCKQDSVMLYHCKLADDNECRCQSLCWWTVVFVPKLRGGVIQKKKYSFLPK